MKDVDSKYNKIVKLLLDAPVPKCGYSPNYVSYKELKFKLQQELKAIKADEALYTYYIDRLPDYVILTTDVYRSPWEVKDAADAYLHLLKSILTSSGKSINDWFEEDDVPTANEWAFNLWLAEQPPAPQKEMRPKTYSQEEALVAISNILKNIKVDRKTSS